MLNTLTLNIASSVLIILGMVTITKRTPWGITRVWTWCTFALTATILPIAFTETRTEQLPLFITAGILFLYFFVTTTSKMRTEEIVPDDGRPASEKVFIGILATASILLIVITAVEKILDPYFILIYGIMSAIALFLNAYNFRVELKVHHSTSFKGWACVFLGFSFYAVRYIGNTIKIVYNHKELLWYEGIISLSLICITLTLCIILYARLKDVAEAFFDEIRTREDSTYY